jgi:hypothetical protein
MSSKIIKSVSDYRSDERGTKRGTFTATFENGVSVKGVMLHGNASKRWVMWPSCEYLRADGVKGYLPIFSFADDLKQRLEAEIFDEFRALKARKRNEVIQ